MEFACLRCAEHVRVALGSQHAKLAGKSDRQRRQSTNGRLTDRHEAATELHSAAGGAQDAVAEGDGDEERSAMERAHVTRCRRCDGLFHAKCVGGEGAVSEAYECSACARDDAMGESDIDHQVELMPLLVPVQALGVLKKEDEEMASEDEEDDWDDLVVLTTDIRVCLTCRQVHLTAEELLPCVQCNTVGQVHRRCQEAAPSTSKSPVRKRKRSTSKTGTDACAACAEDTRAGAVATRRLALLLKPEETQWWETCATCEGQFCLHALVSDEIDDDDELRERLGRDTHAGFQCRSCASTADLPRPIAAEGRDFAEPLVAISALPERPVVEGEDESKVLICDGCDGEFAMEALDPPLLEVPEGDWFCPGCKPHHTEPAALEALEVVVTVLICDGCEGEFEMSPLDSVPDGDWFCEACVQREQETSRAIEEIPAPEPAQAVATVVDMVEPATTEDFVLGAEVGTSSPPNSSLVNCEAVPSVPTCDEAASSEEANLVECDGCDDKYDRRTIGAVSADMPKGDWFCDNCEATRKRRKKGYAAMKMEKLRRLRAMGDVRAISLALEVAKQQLPRQVQPAKKMFPLPRRQASLGPAMLAPVTLLICDGCEGEFDMTLLNPPLASVPKGDWFCAGCAGSANNANRRKLAASTTCSSCATAVRWDRNAQRAASRHGGVILCEPCGHRKLEAQALQSAAEAEKKRKRASYLQPHDGRVNVDPSERIFMPVPVAVSYGAAPSSSSSSSSAGAGSIAAYGAIVCSDDEAGDANGYSDDDDEHVIIVCEICLSEFDMIDVLGESHIAPPRPWYCTPCVKRLKKNRKKKQRISKQMMLEMQLYGGLLRPTAAKFVDPISRALRGKKPTMDEELLALFELVGKRVGIMLSWDKHWVMGRVLSFDPASCVHAVQFDDESERCLPLFAFPIIIGTGKILEVKVPASQNVWWPAEILKMNAIAERQLEQALEDPSLLKAFRLVNVISATVAPGKPSNIACWTPRHLCRSMSCEPSPASTDIVHDAAPDYDLAKKRALDDSLESRKILRSSFGALLRNARASSDSEDVWYAVAQAIVGSAVVVDEKPCGFFKVEAYDASSGRHQLVRGGDEHQEKVVVDLPERAGRVELADTRSLAKLALVLYKAQRGIIDVGTAPDAEDADEITIVQNTSVSIRPPPPPSELQCGKCGLPPVVDGDTASSGSEASLVECVKCCSLFHSYCCDPPHDSFPLVSNEDGGVVLVDDIQTPFVCRRCVSCVGCRVTTSSSWFRWRLPLEVVTLCEDCVRIYDDKCQCAVCNTAIDETMQDESPSLLKCTTCDLWVHPTCEPDTHSAFRRSVNTIEHEFELDIRIPLPDLNAAHVDDGDDDDEDEPVVGKKSKGGGHSSSVAAKSARLVEEDFAFNLKFKETYDSRILHNYECLTCRKVRMLRALYRLRQEDKLDLFKEPVTKTIAPTYFDVIKQPMDLSTMQRRVLDGMYKRVNFRDFRDDFELLCLNAVTFNSRDRDFLIWREAWRFYGQGQKVLRQIVPKIRMKQRGGKNYDALVLAAKRQLPNNSLAGKTKGEVGGDDGDDGDDDDDEDDEIDEDRTEESPETANDENGVMGDAHDAERNGGDMAMGEAAKLASSPGKDVESAGASSVGAADANVSSTLVKTSFERKRAPHLAAGLTFTPQTELGSVPKPHSSYSLYMTMHSRSGSHAYAWIDVCGQCGTRGSSGEMSESLVFCVDCGEGFHTFCAGVDEQKLLKETSQLQASWRCKNCEMCELCGKPHEHTVDDEDGDTKWMVCSHCDRSFHGKCLLPAIAYDDESMDEVAGGSGRHDDSFFCASCVHCKNCGKAASPASYSFDRELCLNCCQAQKSEQTLLSEKTKGLLHVWTADARKQRKDAEKCPMCRLKWTAEDADLIQCDACERWAHPLCDPVFVEDVAKYEALVQDPNAQYVCTVCRSHGRDHLADIPDLAKCQLMIAKIQRTRSLCDARWKEARTQMRQAQKWQEWKENVAIYLYVLRIGEECVKGLAFRSVNFQHDWTRLTSSKYNDFDVPAWLLQKASRYLRYKRYSRGPRAATRKLTRKNENFYSQQGVEKQKEPHAIATIAAQAASCAALIVCVHLLYGWAPLQRVVFHLLEREGHAHGEGLSPALIKALLVENKETLEEEIATIKKQYERRAGKKHLLRLQAEDDDDIVESEISPTGSSVSSLALESTDTEPVPAAPVANDVNTAVATTSDTDVRQPIRLTRAATMNGIVDDSRFCALCFIVGETPACGRLIYVELDQWVHLNCALWSSEVYENTDGVLHKCQKALSRSKTNRCDGCGVLGATIGCAVSRCQRHYHFPCALDQGVVFLPNSETCCPTPGHVQQIAKRLEVPELTNMAWTESLAEPITASVGAENDAADSSPQTHSPTVPRAEGDAVAAPVDTPTAGEQITSVVAAASAPPSLVLSSMIKAPRRCIRVDFSSIFGDTKKRMNALHLKRQVGFRIGALTVHSLGHVVIGNPSFYSREAVFPLGFRSTRIYWSSRAVATRCVYECVVTSTDVEARTRSKGVTSSEAAPALASPKALFQITASDDVDNPIIAASPTEALLELRSRIIALYEDAMAADNPFLRRRSWFSYGLLGHHFFGFGIPEIAREIETLPHIATTAIRRSYVLQRHRQQLQASRKRRRGQSTELLGDEKKFGDHVYVFSHRLPSATELALAMREVEQVVEAEEHARVSTGAVRTDGLEREVVDEAEAAAIKATRRRLNKDATRDSQVQLPSEKTGASSSANATASNNSEPAASTSTGGDTGKEKQGVPMDLEHLPIAMQYRELRRRPFSERLEVRKSKIHGYGLFTKDKFVEGSMIVEYQGQMISQDVADVREKQYEEQGIGSCYMFRLDERTIIDATRCGNLARFMNHSCDPKAFARVVTVENNEKKIVIFAKRTIEAGEEVTYDYKFPIEDEAIRCDCGAPNCIGRMN